MVPSNGVNTARIVRAAASVPEICFHNVKLGQGCFCPHCPTARFPDETTGDEDPADTARLDFIEDECVEVRCKESRNHDDADVYYEVVRFYMTTPNEKVVGYGSTPRGAIDYAMANVDDKCAYCDGDGCPLCRAAPSSAQESEAVHSSLLGLTREQQTRLIEHLWEASDGCERCAVRFRNLRVNSPLEAKTPVPSPRFAGLVVGGGDRVPKAGDKCPHCGNEWIPAPYGGQGVFHTCHTGPASAKEPTTNQDGQQTPAPSGHAGLGTTGQSPSAVRSSVETVALPDPNACSGGKCGPDKEGMQLYCARHWNELPEKTAGDKPCAHCEALSASEASSFDKTLARSPRRVTPEKATETLALQWETQCDKCDNRSSIGRGRDMRCPCGGVCRDLPENGGDQHGG